MSAIALAIALNVVTLKDAIQSAEQHQPQMRQARAQTEGARGVEEQQLAPLLPGVSVSFNYLLTTTNRVPTPGVNTTSGGAIPTITGFSATPSDNTRLTLGVNQLIWDFQSVDRYRASKANIRAYAATEEASLLQVVLGAQNAFFNARAQHSAVDVAQKTLENQLRHLQQVEGFVKVGTQPEIALAQQRSQTATSKLQLIQAQANYRTAKAQLNQAMGVEGPIDYDVANEELGVVVGEDRPVEELLDEALKSRPEFKNYREQMEAQRLTVAAAKGAWLPSLSANASFTNQGLDSAGSGFVSGSNFTYVGLALNWFAAGNGFAPVGVHGQVRQQEAQMHVLEAQLESVRLQARVDVETARLAVQSGKESVIAAGEALTSANEQLRLAEGRFAAGVGNIIELGDAQIAQANAAYQRIQAELNLSNARASLLRALGRPVEGAGPRRQ